MVERTILTTSRYLLGIFLVLGAIAFAFEASVAFTANTAYAANELTASTAYAANEHTSSAIAVNTASAAKKVTVPVITKVTINSKYGTVTESYSYRGNGLVSRVNYFDHNTYYGHDHEETNDYAYTKKNKLSSRQPLFDTGEKIYTRIFARDKKGRITKCTYAEEAWDVQTYKYDKKSLLSTYTYRDLGGQEKWTIKFTYDKNRRVKTINTNGTKYTFKNDKYGNVKKVLGSNGFKHISCKNTYKGGKLVKRVATRYWSSDDNTKYTYAYKYKKVKVPASLERMVKAQQYAIIFDEHPGSIFAGYAGNGNRPFLDSAN